MRVKLLLGAVLAASLLFGAYTPGPMQALDLPDCGKAAVEALSPTQRFYDCSIEFNLALGSGETDPGRRFKLNQAFPDPATPLPADVQPWMAFNPFVRDAADLDGSQQWDQARQYLESVLHYAFEGNTDVDFDVHQHNGDATKRQWYHAPWLHRRCNGREYIHGLTRERRSPPQELAPGQTGAENWAIGFYNAPGGQVVGRVWADPSQINLLDASFPEGTVTFKLLYTMADPVTVPSLRGSPIWKAHTFLNDAPEDQRCNQSNTTGTVSPLSINLRKIHEVRLMQVDVAVRDARATSAAGVQTNWAFGTFVYDGVTMTSDSTADMSPSERWAGIEARLIPVGLSWGTDPDANTDADRTYASTTAAINSSLRESVINRCVVEAILPSGTCTNSTGVRHLGLGHRLNGPVDNPISTCVSCHGRSGVATDGSGRSELFAPAGTPSETPTVMPTPDFTAFFANIPGGAQPAVASVGGGTTTTVVRLDYSLQLRQGIENCLDQDKCGLVPLMAPAPPPAVSTPAAPNRITRDIP